MPRSMTNSQSRTAATLLNGVPPSVAVFAEDLAHRVGDFAEGGPGLHRGDDLRDEVFTALRGALEIRDGPRGGGVVAVGAELLQPGNLMALERRVDAERLDR